MPGGGGVFAGMVGLKKGPTMRFTLLGAGTGIITTLAGANPLFGLAFLAVGYGIDKNKKKA